MLTNSLAKTSFQSERRLFFPSLAPNDRVYDTCRNCESEPADTQPKVARETKRQQPMKPCMYDTRVLAVRFILIQFKAMKIEDLQIDTIYTLDNLILKCIKIRKTSANFVELNSDLSLKYRKDMICNLMNLDTCMLHFRINELKIYSLGRA